MEFILPLRTKTLMIGKQSEVSLITYTEYCISATMTGHNDILNMTDRKL